jgi:hypothetical protein
MSQPARQEIHALYRNYLRLVHDWPADKVRPNRDMKQILTTRVEETFRKPLQNDAEAFDLAEAKKQLDALERLLDNEFKQKVSVHIASFLLVLTGCLYSIHYPTRSSHQRAIQTTIPRCCPRSVQQKTARRLAWQGSSANK